MRWRDCHSFHDFRRPAEPRLLGPIFDYIDGAADDETMRRRDDLVAQPRLADPPGSRHQSISGRVLIGASR